MNRMFRYTKPRALDKLVRSLQWKEKISVFCIRSAMAFLEGLCVSLAMIAKLLSYPYDYLSEVHENLTFRMNDLIDRTTQTRNRWNRKETNEES
jgi:hypothetical protein